MTAAGVSINKKILDGIVIPSVNNNSQKPELPSISQSGELIISK